MISQVYLVQKRTTTTPWTPVAICCDLLTVGIAKRLHQDEGIEIEVTTHELNKIAPVIPLLHPPPPMAITWRNVHVIEMVRDQNEEARHKPRTVYINGKPTTLPSLKSVDLFNRAKEKVQHLREAQAA